MLEKYLREIGLNNKEALIYLALLASDNSSVVDLAAKTKIKRPTVYVVLESLAQKGLVSETTIGKKTHYQAEPPERLETFIERQKIILNEHSKRLKDIIPQIKSVQRESGERPVVRFFEGKEGIFSTNEDIYSKTPDGSPIYMIYSKDLLDEIFSAEEMSKYKKLRLAQKVKSKVLYNYSKGEKLSDETGDRIRIDEKKYPLTCDISIYEDKVRISILGKNLSGIFIKSQDLADTMRSLFNFVFDQKKGPEGSITAPGSES
ncbi:MAG: helix-turn-helix domain-containing protein [Patescibacteria group bacterium]